MSNPTEEQVEFAGRKLRDLKARYAKAVADFEHDIKTTKLALDDAIIRHATVPDAATEELRADKMTAEEAIESVLKRPGMYGLVPKNEHRSMKAERDAALAAVERIREAVSGHPECDRYSEDDVISCGWKSAYASVVAALDGAPEPEVKP